MVVVMGNKAFEKNEPSSDQYPCQATGGKNVVYGVCTDITTQPARNASFCTLCRSPWRRCYFCLVQGNKNSFVSDAKTGCCEFHTKNGTRAKQAVIPAELESIRLKPIANYIQASEIVDLNVHEDEEDEIEPEEITEVKIVPDRSSSSLKKPVKEKRKKTSEVGSMSLQRSAQLVPQLSPHELAILEYLANGGTIEQLAIRRGVQVNSVNVALKKICTTIAIPRLHEGSKQNYALQTTALIDAHKLYAQKRAK